MQHFDEFHGGISGGTLETVYESLKAKKGKAKKSALGFDPIFKNLG